MYEKEINHRRTEILCRYARKDVKDVTFTFSV